jgi:hypothetical protein
LANATNYDSVGWYAQFNFGTDEVVDLTHSCEQTRFVFGAVWDIEGVEVKPVVRGTELAPK